MKTLWPLQTLSEMLGKTVRIHTKDGRILEGEAISFTDPFEVDDGFETIGLDYSYYIEAVSDYEIEMVFEIE